MLPQITQPGYKEILEKNDVISCLFTFAPCWWMNLLCCCCSCHSLLILEPRLFSSPRFLQAFRTTLRLLQHSASWSVKLLGSQRLQGDAIPVLYNLYRATQFNKGPFIMYPCHQFCSSLMQTLSRLLILRSWDNEYVFKSLLTVIIVYKSRQCDTTTNNFMHIYWMT